MTTHDMRISARSRRELTLASPVFSDSASFESLYREANRLALAWNDREGKENGLYLSPADLHAAAVLHYVYQHVLNVYVQTTKPGFFTDAQSTASRSASCRKVERFYASSFPDPLLESSRPNDAERGAETLRGFFVHRIMTTNPAFVEASAPFTAPKDLVFPPETPELVSLIGRASQEGPAVRSHGETLDIYSFLTEPAKVAPDSLEKQMMFILRNWEGWIPEDLRLMLLRALSYVREEHRPRLGGNGGTPEMKVPDYSDLDKDYEAFSADRDWMPNVVMMAKSTLVWLDQLSKKYGRPISRLDQIPDQELDDLRDRGFTALWLIGLWQRSEASKKIKRFCGNPEAEASAYSLYDYEISPSLGGWDAVANLRERCKARGIRLASDMVPNHTGIDSRWVMERPGLFLQQDWPPFPSYTYNGPDLSSNPDVEIKIEDHYYDRTDAAVTFRRVDKRTGRTTYIFHGNDGTSMPWNDTAQLDYLNPETREAVYQEIRHVAQNFPIIRFDAAMTLARRHIRRLWYPQLGSGGDIAGRSTAAMSDAEFNARLPKEFWREVVDRIEKELPDTLLLAEAFWMMEGYFVRTLGMHRVYNSAFMNMLKNQENKKYRDAVKKTLAYEPEILKRYVNFMNNPDEETAIAQFGDGDKYFGVCTLLSTMPGLPMFGHGQIEGYREKYGMEYSRAYWDEKPNEYLVSEHYRRIFPLLRQRYMYSGCDNFNIFDLNGPGGTEESAFVYTNGAGSRRSLVCYNNQYEAVEGTAFESAPKLIGHGTGRHEGTCTIAQALLLGGGERDYLLYTEFPSRLEHLHPAGDIAANGLHIHLNGYETRVWLDVHQETDTDGSYAALWNKIGDSGVPSLREELQAVRLEPLYRAMAPLTGKEMGEAVEKLLGGRTPTAAARKLTLLCEEMYRAMKQAAGKSGDALPLPFSAPGSTALLKELSSLAAAFSSRHEGGFFLHAAETMDEMKLVILSALTLRPFVGKNEGTRPLMEASDRLLLPRFFTFLCWDREEARRRCHLGAILLMAFRGRGRKDIASLLSDQGIQEYAGCNKWKGEMYYKKEAMQEALVVSGMSAAMMGREDSFSARKALRDEENAQYRLALLLKPLN